MHRRSARELDREPAREVIREPVRGATREPIRELIRQPIHELAHQTSRDTIRETAAEPTGPTKWVYRGRSDSEIAINEPIQAPSGLPAQKSEGFQRFYKAVVSPTHVRVTAGGRIVPNNRPPPSPTAKRSKDTYTIDNQPMGDRVLHTKPSINQIGANPPIPVASPFMHGFPPGFQAVQGPISFVPMAFGAHLPPGFPIAQPAMNPSPMPTLTPESTLKEGSSSNQGEARNENRAVGDKQDKVKITPPEFFDHTKPFFYNGQYMYPVPTPFPGAMGNPMMPFQMVGLPHGAAQPMMGSMMQPMPNAATPMMPSAAFNPPNHGQPGMPAARTHPVPANVVLKAPSAPPISSIKPSEITKKQIAGFKQSLKYQEDQLQYNRHQIDEKAMEASILTLRGHIERFETILKSQLEYEHSVLSKVDQNKEDKNVSQSQAPTTEGDRTPTHSALTSEPGTHKSHNMQEPSMDQSTGTQRRRSFKSRQGIHSTIGESGQVAFDFSPEPHRPTFSGFDKGQGLPSDAALAPVFQPRVQTSSWGGSEHSREAQEESERRLLIASGWKPPSYPAENHRSVSHQEPQSHAERSSASSSGRESHFGVPYLLGALPKGVNPRTARDTDYVYNRPLTDEERRARFLYWGKAPKSVIQGLPKFDGKHFYPPSPVKENTASPPQEFQGHRVPSSRADDYDFRMTKSDPDPFRPMTPIQKSDTGKMAMASEDECAAMRHYRAGSFEARSFSGNSEDYQPAVEGMHLREPTAVLESRENSVDGGSVGSHDRRSDKSG